MEPITKVWLFTLNKGHSLIEATFSGLWNETLMVAASYTTVRGETHTLFQSDDEPDLLAIICGYHSIEASMDAQEALGEKLAPLLEFLTHKELFVLHMDVRELPVTYGRIAMAFSESEPVDAAKLPGKGNWAAQMPSFLIEPHDASSTKKKTWIHIAPSEDAASLRQMGSPRIYNMIMEAHISSEPAE
jgi:hypothetical protein